MTTATKSKEHRSSGKGRHAGSQGAEHEAAPPPPPSPSSKRKRASDSGAPPRLDAVRIKVVRPAKGSSSAPAALAPFVGYVAHGRLADAAEAARSIGGGAGGGAGGGDGGAGGAGVHFDVYEAPRRPPVYVAQLSGPRPGQGGSTKGDDDDDRGAAAAAAPEAAAAATAAPRLLLVGRTDGAEQGGASAAGWYAVGVYSRSRGTLTLARAQDGRLARVEPVLPDAVTAAAAAAAERAAGGAAAAAAAGDTAREQSRRLVDAFGSTRRKRQLQAREEGAVRSDRLLEGGAGVQAALARVNAAAAADGGSREAVLARAAAARNVPPHDPSATRPGDAYRVRAFFPPAFWDALNAGQLLAAAEDAEQMAKLRERRLVLPYVLSRCEALLRPDGAAGAGAAGAVAAGGPAVKRESGADATAGARRERARLLAAVAALLTLHAGGQTVRVPVGPGGLDDAARRLRICGRGDALEALLERLYVPAGRVEGEEEAAAAADEGGVGAAAAAAASPAAAAVKPEEEGEQGAATASTAAAAASSSPASRPSRAPRPAADVHARDDRQKALALAYALAIALGAEGWRMSPEAFEALRAELRMGARDLAARFRELGCDCERKSGAAAGAGGAAYSVSLLLLQRPPGGAAAEGEGATARTLEEAFPKAKRPATTRRR